ncbi:hypothetical protein [Paenibacillus sp. FSL R10-2734]|uniref:hypothetical protein n=1 Tax=Paenibacillus sp. FSL R10-2734 TaxID=2954691 RepID=UPI0030DAB276
MSAKEIKQVIVYFGGNQLVKLDTEDPEFLLSEISSEDSGWFRHIDTIINRSEIKYAEIAKPKQRAKVVAKPPGL